MLPLGIQLYSVRNSAQADLKATLLQLKAFGYQYVETAGLYGYTPKALADLLKEVGLYAVSAHVPYAEIVKDPQQVISNYRLLGCKYIAIPWLAEENRINGENGQATLEALNRLVPLFSQNGLGLCYHNHAFEFQRINGEYVYDYMYKAVPALLCEPDTCWISVAGESVVEYLKKYKNRQPVVHIKDYVCEGPQRRLEYRPCGYGVQDMGSIINAAINNGAKYLIVEQDDPSMGKTELECAKLSIEYLRGITK